MKKLLLTILIAGMLSDSGEGLSQTLWEGAACGMSPEEVVSVIPNAKKIPHGRKLKDGKVHELVRLESAEILTHQFVAGFFFHNRKLTVVELSLKEPRSFNAVRPLAEELVAMLRSQYGKEARYDESKTLLKVIEADWVSGEMKINLLAIDRGDNPSFLQIAYEVPLPQDADKR
ncbi:MAG TPA: hypothetical protein PKM59_11840 [Thermodesulfobacteriota bacterium]|nr:hypothetical protein [Thermodesulfobacteriota bacterium]